MRAFRLLLTMLLPCAALAALAQPSPFCFGAAGEGCQTVGERSGAGYCKALPGGSQVECVVHAASIELDVCCHSHPDSRACGGHGADGACAHERDRSQSRTAQGLYWTRRFDSARANRSGVADFSQLCAPAGSVIAAGDERWCCSQQSAVLAERDLQGVNKLRCR